MFNALLFGVALVTELGVQPLRLAQSEVGDIRFNPLSFLEPGDAVTVEISELGVPANIFLSRPRASLALREVRSIS
jgi:hypothetical protein